MRGKIQEWRREIGAKALKFHETVAFWPVWREMGRDKRDLRATCGPLRRDSQLGIIGKLEAFRSDPKPVAQGVPGHGKRQKRAAQMGAAGERRHRQAGHQIKPF
ncbi:hypothetical protein TRM7557_03300 [Tritonibacter multivorans]|uniref:Uncharacterized protein n=1 Tax=Tritonibacter multivorans TaxID=928856 RepID=A0A0N7M0R7_9RHOB|nr:hypothetical protein TRM7557_03300 [Tritonibacter multivorans]SFC31059.1 hypothetical protein SAMN04488049_102136 [Tritonibacter multivorans]